MIRNAREYRITKAAAEKFRAALEKSASPTAVKANTKARTIMIAAVRAQLQELERQLQEYDDLRCGQGAQHLRGRFDRLGELLIKARIVRGWSQRVLGERLHLKMQQIQHYEATEYESASLTRLVDVARALGLTIEANGTLVESPDFMKKKS